MSVTRLATPLTDPLSSRGAPESYDANMAMHAKISATPTNVVASSGVMPKSVPSSNHVPVALSRAKADASDAVGLMVTCDGEEKTRQHEVKHDGNRIAPVDHVSHDHPSRVDPSDDPQRRREPGMVTDKVAAAARELHAHCAKDAEDRDLRCQQERIRQQAGLPVVHRREKRRDTRSHEKLTHDSQREETEQHPKQSRAAYGSRCFQRVHLDVKVSAPTECARREGLPS